MRASGGHRLAQGERGPVAIRKTPEKCNHGAAAAVGYNRRGLSPDCSPPSQRSATAVAGDIGAWLPMCACHARGSALSQYL
jgi:hypothetical protein